MGMVTKTDIAWLLTSESHSTHAGALAEKHH